MESFSVGKRNFTRRGKSATEARLVPRQSAGIPRQAAPSARPAKGPLAKRQSTLVSQASPSGSARSVLAGKRGASERAPQGRGLKTGSIREGSGFTDQEAASAREKKRPRRRRPSSMRSIEVA